MLKQIIPISKFCISLNWCDLVGKDRIIECIYKERPFLASAIVLECRYIKNDDSTERGVFQFPFTSFGKHP